MLPPTALRIVEVRLQHRCARPGISSDAAGWRTTRGSSSTPLTPNLPGGIVDAVLAVDIEAIDREFCRDSLPAGLLGSSGTPRALRDPWSLLAKIRAVIPSSGCIAACIPNAQHWTVQALLNSGAFRYQSSGLLDRNTC